MPETTFDPQKIHDHAPATFSVLARLTNALMVDIAAGTGISVDTKIALGDAVAQIMKARSETVTQFLHSPMEPV